VYEMETNSKSVCSNGSYSPTYMQKILEKNMIQLLFFAVPLKGTNWPGLQPLFEHSMTRD
jgi:hypothetical protein